MPLLLQGNSTPTIPHDLRHLKGRKFPHGCADASNESCRKGSNVYELNRWPWEFWRGKPRLRSVAETEARRFAVIQDEAGHFWVRRSHKVPKAAAAQ